MQLKTYFFLKNDRVWYKSRFVFHNYRIQSWLRYYRTCTTWTNQWKQYFLKLSLFFNSIFVMNKEIFISFQRNVLLSSWELPIFAGKRICRILRMKALSKVLPLFWPSYEMVRYLLFRKILKSQKLLGWNQHFQSIPLIDKKVSKSGWVYYGTSILKQFGIFAEKKLPWSCDQCWISCKIASCNIALVAYYFLKNLHVLAHTRHGFSEIEKHNIGVQ